MPIKRELDGMNGLKSHIRLASPGTDLYRQGDLCPNYFLVIDGWVALSVVLDDGSCQILDFVLPGTLLGFQSDPDAHLYHSARCLSFVRVCRYPRQDFDAVIAANPRLALLLSRQAASSEARVHAHLVNVGLRSARERIAHLLLELYLRAHRRPPTKPGDVLHLPVTQSHVGQAVGLTAIHVSRTLTLLREQRVVHLANHVLTVLDPVALIGIAGTNIGACDILVAPLATPDIRSFGSRVMDHTGHSATRFHSTAAIGWSVDPNPVSSPQRRLHRAYRS